MAMLLRFRHKACIAANMQERTAGTDKLWKMFEFDEDAWNCLDDCFHLACHDIKGFGIDLASRSQNWACSTLIDNAEFEAPRLALHHFELLGKGADRKVLVYL